MRRKEIRGVIHNFLGTYTSRYSHHKGYWLFGQLIDELDPLNVSLLNTEITEVECTLMTTARRLATRKFIEQLKKAGLQLEHVREACMTITRSKSSVGNVNGHYTPGFEVAFMVRVVMDNGRSYEETQS